MLVAFDVVAACSSYVLGLRIFAFPGSLFEGERIVGVLGFIAAVAIVAAFLAFPYVAFVGRSRRKLIRRAILGGMAYAAAVIVLSTAWPEILVAIYQIFDRTAAPPPRDFGSVVAIVGLVTVLGIPFIVLGGSMFGAIHGFLTLRLGRATADAPIVAT